MSSQAAKSAYLGWLAAAIADEKPCPARNGQASADVVLGYATGYGPAEVAPFVRSLRQAFDGAVALVVDDRPDMKAFLDSYGVEAVAPPGECSRWKPHAVMARFAAFDRMLAAYPDAGSVLLTDVRDVIFQGAPFDPAPHRVELFIEGEQASLKGHAFNMKHLRALAGDEIAGRMAEQPCVCVGTVMGPRAEIVRFCRTLLMLGAIPRSQTGGAFGADQAACNLAAHLGLVDADIRANYGRVATIGLSDGSQIGLRDDGVILNPDGGFSPIVHQYDRHPHLERAVDARYRPDLPSCPRCGSGKKTQKISRLKQSLLRRLPELR